MMELRSIAACRRFAVAAVIWAESVFVVGSKPGPSCRPYASTPAKGRWRPSGFVLGRWEQALSLSRNPGSSPHQSLFTAVIHLSHPSRLRCLALVRAHFLSGELARSQRHRDDDPKVAKFRDTKSQGPAARLDAARFVCFVRSFGRVQRWARLRPGWSLAAALLRLLFVVEGRTCAGQISSRLVRPNLVGRLRARYRLRTQIVALCETLDPAI